MATVLVTGGSGFIGSHALLQLLATGHEVRTTIRSLQREAGLRALLRANAADDARLHCFVTDLTQDAGWTDAVAGCDFVLHIASPFPDPPSTIARSHSPRATASAAGRTNAG